MNNIFNKTFGIICYIIGILFLFDFITLENIGDPFPLIFVLLGSLLIENK